MALRIIKLDGDPVLRKISKPIDRVTERIEILLDDMVETMVEANGIGLAAPQVGVLRRAIVVDVGEGVMKMINPEILEKDGAVVDVEGCLSIPNKSGTVERPENIKVKYTDENNEEQIIQASELLARAICHEIDHLNGVLYTDKVIDYVDLEDLEEIDEDE
nr:peptide deformylase [Tissierella sp.]